MYDMASRTVSKVYVASKISQLLNHLNVASTLLNNSVAVSYECDKKTVVFEELELCDNCKFNLIKIYIIIYIK